MVNLEVCKAIKRDHSNIGYVVALFLLWSLSPYMGIFVALILILKININETSVKTIFFFISLSFALLAYTQKSLYWEGTDIQRYYDSLSPFINADYSSIVILLAEDNLTYIFTPVNVLLVSITHNVQSVSLLWTFLIYYLFFLSIYNYIDIYHKAALRDRYLIFYFTIFSIFASILFVQVTDTIKSAVSFSLFFYIFTLYLKNTSKVLIGILLFLCVGIHSQTLMFLPIFLYKYVKFKKLLLLTIIAIALCTQVNLIDLATSILPSSGWTEMLIERTSGYGDDTGESSSKRYIFIGFLCLAVCVYLYIRKYYNDTNKIGNVILVYIIIMFLNYNNSNAFIRFANFISFIVTIEFVELFLHKKTRQLSILFMVIFMILNLQRTFGRTLAGGYCSSYMDNSIGSLLFSNIIEYLTYKAY